MHLCGKRNNLSREKCNLYLFSSLVTSGCVKQDTVRQGSSGMGNRLFCNYCLAPQVSTISRTVVFSIFFC